jgi:hypothetical protein
VVAETIEEHHLYQVSDGVLQRSEAIDHEAGSILSVTCTCDDCRHLWRPRGIQTLDDFT